MWEYFFDLLTGKTYFSDKQAKIVVPVSLGGEIVFALSSLPNKPDESRGRLNLTTTIRKNVPQFVWVDTGNPEVHDYPHSEEHEQEQLGHTVKD